MSEIPKIARELNSAGVEWEQAQVHAEVITTSVNGALEQVATKEFVNSKIAEVRAEMQTGFAEVDAKNAELRAEMQTGFAEVHAKNAELRAEMQTGFAEVRAEIAEVHAKIAEVHAKNAELRAENKASQLQQLRWIVGTILAIGSLQIAAQFFT